MKIECKKCGYMNDKLDKSCMSCGALLKEQGKGSTTSNNLSLVKGYADGTTRPHASKLKLALGILIVSTILVVVMYLTNIFVLEKGFGFFFWLVLLVNNVSLISVFVFLYGFIGEYIQFEEDIKLRIEILEKKARK